MCLRAGVSMCVYARGCGYMYVCGIITQQKTARHGSLLLVTFQMVFENKAISGPTCK